ncbi:MAG: class I SAM-dependent methyltransferase [Spirochaetota bacterium]
MSDASRGQPASRWDERYAADDYLFGTEPNGFLLNVEPELPRGEALCYGDGEGRNGVFLATRGHRVTSMDASAVGLEKARRLAERNGVALSVVQGDLREFDFGRERWDLIVSIFVHLPPELRREVHRRAAAALRPGGCFVIEAYTPEQLEYRTGGPPVRELLMTLDDVRSDLSGLEFEIAREQVRDVIEGQGHRGRAAVLQVLARKR